MKEGLDYLAKQYDGQIQFAYVIKNDEELLSLSFWVYRAPRSYLFTMDGNAHVYEEINVDNKKSQKWIDTKQYLKSPLTFKLPQRI